MDGKPKVVILCGGQGTRMREETEYRPKPLVPVGDTPILWHIMKIYSHYGFRDFVLCLGYKGRMIKEFFMDYEWDSFDFSMNLREKDRIWHKTHETEDWNITFANTGEHSLTGARVKAIKKYVGDSPFMLTYGDGLADIDIGKLWEHHKQSGKLVTLTCVHPVSKFGIVSVEGDGSVAFVEKPPLKDWISGGFMVCSSGIFDLLTDGMLENDLLPHLAENDQISIYQHEGFWHAMDTYKDHLDLTKIWNAGDAPWKVWR